MIYEGLSGYGTWVIVIFESGCLIFLSRLPEFKVVRIDNQSQYALARLFAFSQQFCK